MDENTPKKEGSVKKKKGSFFGKTFKLIILLIILVGVCCVMLNEFYINILWFKEVGYLGVFFKSLVTKLKLGLPLFALMFIILSVYFKLLTFTGGKSLVVETGKKSFAKGKLPYLIAFVISLLSSMVLTSQLWYKFLEFTNSTDFGKVDQVFGLDISFYMFKLPFFESLLGLVFYILIVLFAATLFYSFIIVAQKSSADKQFDPQNIQIDKTEIKGFFSRMWLSFRTQLTVFLAIFLLIIGAYFFLQRYELLFSTNGIVFGASYTDLHITLPLLTVLTVLCAVAALMTIIFGLAKKIKPIAFIYAAVVAVYFLGQGAGLLVESLIVSPNEYSKESMYIDYNIQATQNAYGLNEIQTKTYTVENTITAEDIAANETTIGNIPINDYSPTLNTYNSLQSMRTYYEFTDVDVDRYNLDGDYTQVFISAREMNTAKLNTDAQTWINTYLKYTHGFGIAVSPVNTTNETGQPLLIAKDIPTVSDYKELSVDEPRIYFGEDTDTYAVVNTKAKEFDYPAGSDNMETSYAGTAGIPMSFLNKISFAVSEGTIKFLLSSDITSESKILIKRNVLERVGTIAPFLSYDSDIYMVAANGRLYWVIDAMTMSDRYPYAQPSGDGYNYIRNSVKVVVDAYNGTVDFYIVDENDPIAQVYSKIYPDLFKKIDDMPKEIRAHLRYSEAFFSVQAAMYSTYHMNNTSVFYNKEDAWSIATQYYDADKSGTNVNPAYLIMKLPDREEEFLLMVPYTAVNKNNMVAWMAGVCDGDEYGKLIVYEFNKQSLVYGPMQIEQRIDQDTIIAPQLALLGQQGSSVLRGNLLTIPVEDSILYIEPIYVMATESTTSLPEMKKVVVSYKDNIVMADNLKDGLALIFGSSEDEEGDNNNTGDDTPATNPDGTISSVKQLATQAQNLYAQAQNAMKNGDWASYGNYMDELEVVLNQLANYSESSTVSPTEETTAPETVKEETTDDATEDNE